MRRSSKTILSLAAASMVLTQTAQMAVLANGYEALNESLSNTRKTKIDIIQDQILEAQKSLDEVQSHFDNVDAQLKNSSENVNAKKASSDKAVSTYNTKSTNLNNYVSNKIQLNQSDIEQAKQELAALKAEKERLEKESEDSKAQKAQFEQDYKDAQSRYDELVSKGSVEELNAQIAEKKKSLETVQKQYDEASAKCDEIMAKRDEADSQIKDLEKQINDEQAIVDALKNKVDQDQVALQDAQAEVDRIQKAYDATTDESAKQELQTQLNVAEANLKSLNESLMNTYDELYQARDNVSHFKGYVKSWQEVYDESVKDVNDAKDNLAIYQKQLEDAQKIIDQKQQLIDAANTEIESAKKEVDEKKAKLDAYDSKASQMAELVETTRKAYAAIVNQANSGSLGFFESIGDKQAVDVIKEGIQLGTTKLGDVGDATSLFNMKVSIPLMAECNRLRALNGLPELKTSALMMAISQVKLNHTEKRPGTYNSPHTGLYSTGENLAFGYSWNMSGEDKDNEGKGPFFGWYGCEKKFLQDFYEEHPEEKDKDPWNTIQRYPDLWEKIGHYLNLLDNGTTLTGTSFVPSDISNNFFGSFAQQFSGYTENFDEYGFGLSSAISKDKQYNTCVGAMTVSEFETMFNKYYDNLDKNVASKKAAYEAALKQAQEFNDSSMSSELKTIYDAYLVALNNLKNKEDAMNGVLEQIDNAQNSKEYLENQISSSKRDIESLEKKANENESNLNDGKQSLKAWQDVVEQKNKEVADLKEKSSATQKEIESLKQAIKDTSSSSSELKSKLDAAKRVRDEKTSVLNDSKKAYEDVKKILDTLNVQKNELKTKSDNLRVEHGKCISDKNEKETLLQLLNVQLKKLESQKSELIRLETTLKEDKNKITELNRMIQQNSESLGKNKEKTNSLLKDSDKLSAEKTRLDIVKKMYEAIVSDTSLDSSVSLTSEETQLFNELKTAKAEMIQAQKELGDAKASYEVDKKNYDEAKVQLDAAKAELKKAQDELKKYLVLQSPGWHKVDQDWYYVDSNGNLVTNKWQGNYYLESDGKMATNKWIDNFYVGSDGQWIENKWIQSGNRWWYRHGDGKYTSNDFETISGQTYYFDASGYMVTGWKQIQSNWYYFNASGVMVKNAWQGAYYFGADGVMYTNTFTPDGYYVGSDGVYVRNQKVTVDGKVYCLNADGKVAKNQWSGDYYLDGNGNVIKNKWIGNYWCGADGRYARSSWVDNGKYYVGSNGVYVTNQWVGDYYLNGTGLVTKNAWVGNYWCGEDGKYVKSSWVDNNKSYVNQNGVYLTNQWIGDYYLNGSGVKVTNAWVGSYWCGSDGKYVKSFCVDNNRYYVNENGVYVAGAWEKDSKGWKYHAGSEYAKDITLNINGTAYTFDSNGYMK